MHQTVNKRKNWSTPQIKGVHNFWWQMFRGSWSAISKFFNQWLEQPDEITDRLTQGRYQTVLLPKAEDLSNERNYCPATCLNICFEMLTNMIGNYMKEHAEKKHVGQKPTENLFWSSGNCRPVNH